MQVYALFAVLSYLSTSYAAPLLIGIPGIAQIDVKLPTLPKGQSLTLPSISIPAIPAIPSGTAGAAAAQSAVAAVIADSKDAIKSLAGELGIAIPSEIVSVSINPDLLASATAAFPVPTGALTAAPADLLKKVGELVGGFKQPTKAQDAVAQLKQAQADLEAASKGAVASLKTGTTYTQYLPQTAALVRNVNNFVDNLPKKVADDSSVKQAATQLDQTLSDFLKSLSSSSGSSSKFGDEIFKAGVNVKTITSSLLKQTTSAIPKASLTSLFPGFNIPNFA